MDINNLLLEEIEQLQKKLYLMQEEKTAMRKNRETALMAIEPVKCMEPNYFMHLALSVPKRKPEPIQIPQFPEWMSFDKNQKPQSYWYVFDYEFPYITCELKKNPKIIGYYESDLRNQLQKVGDNVWRHGKYFIASGPEHFLNILEHFPEGKVNKWTLRFKAKLVVEVEDFSEKIQIRQELNKVNLSNVDEYIEKKYGGYPVEGKNGHPFKNQKLGLMHTINFMPFALLWEMGTGKTRTAIETFVYYRGKAILDKCLVVCPVSVIDNWENEIYKWSECSVTVLRGTKEEKLALIEEDSDFYITNYESLLTFNEILRQWITPSTMIIADESTKVKNPNAKRTKALISVSRNTKYKLIMTGTPVTQHAYDLFAPFLFLDGGETFGLSHQKFIEKYYWSSGYRLLPRPNSLEKISNKMYYKGLRFLKQECIDIPDKIYIQRVVEMPEYNKKKYQEMRDYAITQIENSEKITAAIILVQLLRLSQITSGFVSDESGNEINFSANPKIDCLEDILEDLGEDQKVIIWARFKRDIKNIMNLLTKLKLEGVALYGDIKPEERNSNIRKFENDPKVQVIAGTPGTGGLGINLTAGNLVIYYSNSYSLQDRLQSEDRTHRAGQTKKVTYIDILCKETIDIGIYKILKNKKDVADVVTKDNLRGII